MDKKRLRNLILSEINKLEESLPGLERASAPVSPSNSIGRLSRMEAIAEAAIHGRTLEQAKIRLSSLRATLSRIDEAGFGLCAECEEPITEKRLLAVPESRICMDCLTEN